MKAGHRPSYPHYFLLFGQLWARKAVRLFLVGLSPGRRDVQKSTGQAKGLAKVRVKRLAEEEGAGTVDRTKKYAGPGNSLAERSLSQLRPAGELWGHLRFLCPIFLISVRDFCGLHSPLPLTEGNQRGLCFALGLSASRWLCWAWSQRPCTTLLWSLPHSLCFLPPTSLLQQGEPQARDTHSREGGRAVSLPACLCRVSVNPSLVCLGGLWPLV